jgi:fructose-specific phosphotransferase system component IIB
MLSREEEETEIFIEEYINQTRCMNKLSDIQIKIVMRELLTNDPEWFEVLKERFKKKQFVRQAVKDVIRDPSGVIKDLARRVA